MSAPITTSLLSYGMSGRIFHAPFLSTNAGFKLKAVVERHNKKMVAAYPDIISYDTVVELLNDPEIELVIVNTPNFTHFDFAKKSLLAGKHVLIEKPAAANSKEVKELYDLAKSLGLHVMVYQNRRWDSDFLAVKEVIESGKLGRLTEVHLRYDRYKPILGVKPFKETGGTPINGLVYDLGPHIIDQALLLFGRPLSLNKVTAKQREGSEVIDYFSFQLVYPDQLRVFITGGMLIPEPLPAYVIHGSLGSFLKDRCDVQEPQLDSGMLPTDPAYGIEKECREGKLVTMGLDDQKNTEWITSGRGNYNHLFDAVYHTIRNNTLYPITEEHISWQMELLEA
jgi:scyllo-inositol 2-dehydrogenase (NADP+)